MAQEQEQEQDSPTMSFGGALQIGRSALISHQAAIEVAGNNLANLATEEYHRQRIELEPLGDHQIQTGIFVGRGVQVASIRRLVDAALEGRIRGNIADQSYSLTRGNFLRQIEALQNEFSNSDLSSHLNAFFGAWSGLANNPRDNAQRSIVLREGANLASFVTNLHRELTDLRNQVDRAIDGSAVAADDLITQIEQVNQQIVKSGLGQGSVPALADKRDGLLTDLSEFLDISVIEQDSGTADVFVGSIPIILNGQSRGFEVRKLTEGNDLKIDVVLSDNGSVLLPTAGRLGAELQAREQDVNFAIDELQNFVNTLIFEVNKTYSQGQGLQGVDTVTAGSRVTDQTEPLNQSDAGLKFTPVHGSFQIHMLQRSTGQRKTSTIQVDLDGIDPTNDTTLPTLSAAIDAVNDLNSSITTDGRLVINAATADFKISFSHDTSGVLSALGINTFFAGSDAQDIAVNSVMDKTPSLLAAGRDHVPGDNRNALAVAQLRDDPISSLNGLSLNETWSRHVELLAVRLSQTNQRLEAETVVGEHLAAKRQAVSGVNADEEAINLLAFQRAYQSSARFLQVVNELLDTLLSLA